MSHVHIKILTDNVTAVTYIRQMGGSHSLKCNDIAREIWLWAIERDIWLTISHIPGKDNVRVDSNSRKFEHEIEWMLNTKVFELLTTLWPNEMTIDLFASRLNHQLDKYVSWRPDPDSIAVDAFSIKWDSNIYALPPFSTLSRVLKKIREDKAKGVLVVPYWIGATWFPSLLRLLTAHPLLVNPHQRLLTLPAHPQMQHTLHKKLSLLICKVSGVPSETQDY